MSFEKVVIIAIIILILTFVLFITADKNLQNKDIDIFAAIEEDDDEYFE